MRDNFGGIYVKEQLPPYADYDSTGFLRCKLFMSYALRKRNQN
jgi:hypothetical protein